MRVIRADPHEPPVAHFLRNGGGEYGDIRKVAVAQDDRGALRCSGRLEQNPGKIINDPLDGVAVGPCCPVGRSGVACEHKPVESLGRECAGI